MRTMLDEICLCGAPTDASGRCTVDGCVASRPAAVSCEHPIDEILVEDIHASDGEIRAVVQCRLCGARGVDCCPLDQPYSTADLDRDVAFDRACADCGVPSVYFSRSRGDVCACVGPRN